MTRERRLDRPHCQQGQYGPPKGREPEKGAHEITALHDPVEIIQRALDEWDDTPPVETEIFATVDASVIADMIADFCEAHLGSRADRRMEHIRFEDGRMVTVYDWDSLVYRQQTQIVGGAAAGFTADWSREDVRHVPAGSDIRAFIADYEGRHSGRTSITGSIGATCIQLKRFKCGLRALFDGQNGL